MLSLLYQALASDGEEIAARRSPWALTARFRVPGRSFPRETTSGLQSDSVGLIFGAFAAIKERRIQALHRLYHRQISQLPLFVVVIVATSLATAHFAPLL